MRAVFWFRAGRSQIATLVAVKIRGSVYTRLGFFKLEVGNYNTSALKIPLDLNSHPKLKLAA